MQTSRPILYLSVLSLFVFAGQVPAFAQTAEGLQKELNPLYEKMEPLPEERTKVVREESTGYVCDQKSTQESAEQKVDGKTLEEFKEYVAGKFSGLSDDHLNQVANLVDTDGDEIISDAEFENRMSAIRAVMRGESQSDPDESQVQENSDEKTPMAPVSDEANADKENNGNAIAGRADVLIVTNDELSGAWKKFADWKTCTGRPAKIVTTESIDRDFSGDDIQQKIRACCLQHINEEETKWVILGGDSSGEGGIVPDRDTDHSECKMLPYEDIPTDLYYISEKDWDANDDGRYGVFEDDMEEVAYYNPKASIGRIPVRTAEDVAAYTTKVIAYESAYPVGDFARRMIYTCPEKHAYPKLETSMKEVADQWRDGYIGSFFGDQTPWDDQKSGEHDLSATNWVNMLNKRRASKIHMHGHGLLHLWALEKKSTVTKSHIAKLENENAYPVITTVSCLTGQYDNKKDPCIAESMLRQPNAGAIAILAPSREGVPFFKKRSEFRLMVSEGKMDGTTTAYTKFWKNTLGEGLTLGDAFRKVKMEMESDARENDGFHMVQCELNLLGDPSLSVHQTPPSNVIGRARISGDKLIVRGLPGNAKVCVWDGAQEYQLLDASKKGKVEISLNQSSKEYRVAAMASGHNIWSTTIENEAATAVFTSDKKKDKDEDEG